MIKDEVSIVIVSMNRMDNLDVCIPSIERYTKCKHKIYVVAYMFSKENLADLREKYPQVLVVESNEIRGFSENNNLALRQVASEFVFVQNDDTEYKEPVLDKLLDVYKKTPEATIMSPVLLLGNGKVQYKGRRPYTYLSYVLGLLGIHSRPKSKYENQSGIFKSYNVSGAAFLIRTDDFRRIGFFDERFFFCPEDIVVSTTINKMGGKCYVDSDTYITHYHGVSSRKTKLFYATTCAAYLGNYIFYCENCLQSLTARTLLRLKITIMSLMKQNQHRKDYVYIYRNVLAGIKKHQTPKGLFIQEYKKVTGL